ncbi:MAG: hypothetical protein QM484_09510 [Woeseiaceae bacterium]
MSNKFEEQAMLNNFENSKPSVNSKKEDVELLLEQSFKMDEIKRITSRIAKGIILRLQVQGESNELTTLIGSGYAGNNFSAIKEWLLEINPEPKNFTVSEVDECTDRLIKELDEHIYC